MDSNLVRMNIFNNTLDGYTFELKVNHSNSSNGVLAKAMYTVDGVSYLIKTGEFTRPKFSNIEPVTEAICSEIINLLGVECAEYFIREINIEGTEYWKSQKVLCSFSKNFLSENETIISASKLLKIKSKRATYDSLVKTFDRLDVNNMIVVDYIIGNSDRHLKNFGYVFNTETGRNRFTPLYDHGFCLGQDLDSDYLESESDDFSCVYEECDYAKCCEVTNLAQLSHVNFTTVNLNIDVNSMLDVVDKYKGYIPSYRLEFMKYLLERRMSYARKVFSKNEGIYFRRNN